VSVTDDRVPGAPPGRAGLAARLVEVAARLVATEGLAGLSTRRVAAEAGTSTMAVYSRFGSMPDLVAAVVKEAFQRFGDELSATAKGTGDPLSDLAALGLAYRRFALAHPHLYKVMFDGAPAGRATLNDEDRAAAFATFDILVAAVARAIEAGSLGGEADLGALQIWAAVHGAMSIELAGMGPGGEEAERLFMALSSSVLVGLGADREAVQRAAEGQPTRS
jgi:AcrR family transcriptional regulator